MPCTFFNFFCLKSLHPPVSQNPFLLRHFRYSSHCELGPGGSWGWSSEPVNNLIPRHPQPKVAVFWDLDNKPPKSFPPYEVALKLRTAASSFGVVRYMVAYANPNTFSYVPKVVRKEKKERRVLRYLENKGLIRPVEPYLCGVCGRKFFNNERLMNHFKQIHEREHQKRVNQIESARGKRRLKLVGRYAMKMDKYQKAARGFLTPKVGYGLGDELMRAGFLVRAVSEADVVLRHHIVDVMDRRSAGCLVLVSDDSGFVEVLEAAKLRCLKTVVVGDANAGALKRVADTGFSWQEILTGKAKKEAGTVVGRWKDQDVLKRLEWTYNPEEEKGLSGVVVDEFANSKKGNVGSADDDDMNEDGDAKSLNCGDDDRDHMHMEDTRSWWELDSDSEIIS